MSCESVSVFARGLVSARLRVTTRRREKRGCAQLKLPAVVIFKKNYKRFPPRLTVLCLDEFADAYCGETPRPRSPCLHTAEENHTRCLDLFNLYVRNQLLGKTRAWWLWTPRVWRKSLIYCKVFICRIISPSQSLFADGGFTWLI